jgi:hypothetical protein
MIVAKKSGLPGIDPAPVMMPITSTVDGTKKDKGTRDSTNAEGARQASVGGLARRAATSNDYRK